MTVSAGEAVVEYRSKRNALFGKGSTDLAIEIGEKFVAQDFDNFLTARYRLYAVHRNRVAFAEIEHDPWPLQNGKLLRLNEDLVENCGLAAPTGEPYVHFSRQMEVTVGPLRWF